MDFSGPRYLNLATSFQETWAAVSPWLQTAARLCWRPKVSAFQQLPSEVILDIMCHTASDDLKRLIRTDKSMDEIFKTHKRCIFKRMQRYQFPEFLECFGERPGFDGPVSGDSRTFEQIQCLKDVILSFHWLRVILITSGGIPARLFLHLLERYSGWRYLYFLEAVKRQIEEDAQRLRRISFEGKLDMTGEQAKAMALGFSRMSWNAAALGGEAETYAEMSEVDRVTEVRIRVKNRLKFFRKEPATLQELMARTLTVLIFRIAQVLRLDFFVTRYQKFYLPAGMASLTIAQIVAGWDDLASKIMAVTLLECFFFYGLTNSLRLCEEPFAVDLLEAETLIVWEFCRNLEDHLQAVASGTVPHVHPDILEGWLWAAGLEFPIFGWFVTDRGSIN